MAITLSGNGNQPQQSTQPTQSVESVPKKTISLQKGGNLSLTKEAPGLNNILVGLGWDTNKYDGGFDFDLDASVFMLNGDGKVPSNDEFIFYGQKTHASGAVEHTGDNRTGAGDGDDETIKVDLSKVPANIDKIAFTVTIYEATNRKQNFGLVENAYIRIVNAETNEEVVRYDLGEDFSVENSVNVGEIYRYNGEWNFEAVGAGYSNELKGFTDRYGVVLG